MSIGVTGINSAIGQSLGKFGADGGTGGSSSGGGGGGGPTVAVRNVGGTTSVYEASAGSTISMSGESSQTGIIYDVVVTAPINATIKAWGGGGGGTKRSSGVTGGNGGYSTGSYTFQPGSYIFYIGGAGEGGSENPASNAAYGAVATGGGTSGSSTSSDFDGGGGGGFTGVIAGSVTSPAQSNSVIIAGGGGANGQRGNCGLLVIVFS